MKRKERRTSDGFIVWLVFIGCAILFGRICGAWYW